MAAHERTLTRRQTLLAGAGVLLGATVSRWTGRAEAVAGSAPPTLLPLSADVWATSLDVAGTPAHARLTAAGEPVASVAHEGGFEGVVALAPGATTVVAQAGRRGSAEQAYNGRVRDAPVARVSVGVQIDIVRLDASASQPDPYTAAPIASVEWSSRDGTVLGSGMQLQLGGPWPDGEHYVVARVTDVNGRADSATIVFVVTGGHAAAVDLVDWQAPWVRGAIVYGAIPPLFGQPPLRALEASLDRLAALGVTVIWVAPVFATTEGDFGYAVTDHFSIRPDYGDLGDLQSLVAAAHARGLKVILDLPLNDTSSRHPYYRQARSAGDDSHYWNFYERDDRGHATHYFDWRNLPNLNYANGEVRALATEAAAYWIRVADVDGFRCDAAWGVQERAPDFWPQWCADLKRIRPDLLLLAEASAVQAWPAVAGFSAAYDWTEELGAWAWQRAFSQKREVASRLAEALAAADATRPFRFLENNDTGARFITRRGAPMTRAAAALLFSLPGIPCIYTGQEIGAEFEPYRRERPLDWSDDPLSLEPFYAALIHQRTSEPALAEGRLRPVACSSARILACVVTSGALDTLIAVNFSSRAVRAVVDVGTGAEENQTVDVAPWSAVHVPVGQS